jgi:hypothetical protein
MSISDHIEIPTNHPRSVSGGERDLSSSEKAGLSSGEEGAQTLVINWERLVVVEVR